MTVSVQEVLSPSLCWFWTNRIQLISVSQSMLNQHDLSTCKKKNAWNYFIEVHLVVGPQSRIRFLHPWKCFITGENIIYFAISSETHSKKMRAGSLVIDFFHRIKMESWGLKPPEPRKCMYTPNRDGLLSSSSLLARWWLLDSAALKRKRYHEPKADAVVTSFKYLE